MTKKSTVHLSRAVSSQQSITRSSYAVVLLESRQQRIDAPRQLVALLKVEIEQRYPLHKRVTAKRQSTNWNKRQFKASSAAKQHHTPTHFLQDVAHQQHCLTARFFNDLFFFLIEGKQPTTINKRKRNVNDCDQTHSVAQFKRESNAKQNINKEVQCT
jgi:hypothetical protein